MRLFSHLQILIYALISPILCSCDRKSESPAPPQNSTGPANPQSTQVNKPFSIKGFYIGMPLQEARQVASQKLAEIGVTDAVTSEIGDFVEGVGRTTDSHAFEMALRKGVNANGYPSGGYPPWPLIVVLADKYDRVTLVTFTPFFVNDSFNVRDLDVNEFANQVVVNYGIPAMDHLYNTGYFYINVDQGFEVRIGAKYLSLRNVPKRLRSAPPNAQFSLEGFYIGMPLNEARKIASERLAEIGITDTVTSKNGDFVQGRGWTTDNHQFEIALNKARNANADSAPESFSYPLIVVLADTDDRVTLVNFKPLLVNSLFIQGSSYVGFDVIEFATEIAQTYGIPAMEPLPSGRGYSYKNLEAGFEVATSADANGLQKELYFRKVPKPTERHFDQ